MTTLTSLFNRMAKQAEPHRDVQRAVRRSLEQAGYLPPAQGWALFHARSVAVLSSVLTLSIMGVTGTYAYVSDDVLPDTPLYVVRQTIERAELTLAVTPTAQVQVKQKLVQRRQHEAVVITERRVRAAAKVKKVVKPLKTLEIVSPASMATGISLEAVATTSAGGLLRDASRQEMREDRERDREARRKRRQEGVDHTTSSIQGGVNVSSTSHDLEVNVHATTSASIRRHERLRRRPSGTLTTSTRRLLHRRLLKNLDN